jgi:phage-related protein
MVVEKVVNVPGPGPATCNKTGKVRNGGKPKFQELEPAGALVPGHRGPAPSRVILNSSSSYRIWYNCRSVGLPYVTEPHVRHIRGQLWEIRLKGKAGIARALYVTARAQRVVILRAFIKKTEKTPPAEIELGLKRAKELKP